MNDTFDSDFARMPKRCSHPGAIAVKSGGEVVAGLCPICDEQLPASWFASPRDLEDAVQHITSLGEPFTVADIAQATGHGYAVVTTAIAAMAGSGLVRRVARGVYEVRR